MNLMGHARLALASGALASACAVQAHTLCLPLDSTSQLVDSGHRRTDVPTGCRLSYCACGASSPYTPHTVAPVLPG